MGLRQRGEAPEEPTSEALKALKLSDLMRCMRNPRPKTVLRNLMLATTAVGLGLKPKARSMAGTSFHRGRGNVSP